MKKIVSVCGLLALLGVLGIGCGGPDNLGACQNYVATVSALPCIGDYTPSDSSCDAYANYECDVTDYFNCLSTHYVCDGDMLDLEEYSKTSECSAACN